MSSSYLACNNFYSKVKTDTKIYDEFRSQVINTKAVISNSIKFGNGSFLISPTGSNFVAKFVVDNSLSDVYINVDINTDNANIGDTCVIMANNLYNNKKSYISFTKRFFYTACGDDQTEINNRFATKFIFDGEKYVCTYDNC
jgi:acetyltransferase-like isoleucine patch superfamily enzyme